jgi:copper resistance protein B
MKFIIILLSVLLTTKAIAQTITDHSAHVGAVPNTPSQDSAVMPNAQHTSAMIHGDTLNYLLLAERVEYLKSDSFLTLVWDMQGWVGNDYHKLWLKTEGTHDNEADSQTSSANTTASKQKSDSLEVQALYSKAIVPFWDLQTGLRHNSEPNTTNTYAVIGVMGLAPYWFHIDTAAFLSTHGDLSTRLQVDYDLRFTQRLLLQPSIEFNYNFSDDNAEGIGRGMGKSSFGLRLRWEIRPEFAPYVGLEWSRIYDASTNLLAAAGTKSSDVEVVAGIRFWY